MGGRVPTEITGGAAGADSRAQDASKALKVAERFGAAEAAAAGDDNFSVLEANALGLGLFLAGDAGADLCAGHGDRLDAGAAGRVGFESLLRLGADCDDLGVGLDGDDLACVAAVAAARGLDPIAVDFERESVHRGGGAKPGCQARGEVATHARLGDEYHGGAVGLDDRLHDWEVAVSLVLGEGGVVSRVDSVRAGRACAGRNVAKSFADQGEGDAATELGRESGSCAEQLTGWRGEAGGVDFADDEDGCHVGVPCWLGMRFPFAGGG